MADFRSVLQTDGHLAYEALVKEFSDRLIPAGCWMHTRRGFDEALATTSHPLVAETLARIQLLYDIDDRTKKLSFDERRALHERESRPLVERLPKSALLSRLREEGPAFLRTLTDMVLPPTLGRLRIPVVETDSKRLLQDLNRNAVERFIDEACRPATGQIRFAEFYECFAAWLPPDERHQWNRTKVSKSLPAEFKPRPGRDNARFIFGLEYCE